MYQADFNSCWTKFSRAKDLRDTVGQHFMDKFVTNGDFPRVGIKFKANTGEHVVYVNYMPDLEDSLRYHGAILGELIRDLRSSLDHLAFQLALRNANGQVIQRFD